jgi:hypothetical protein
MSRGSADNHPCGARLYGSTRPHTLVMTLLSHPSEIDAAVANLAAIIDVDASDYPLVSVCHDVLGPRVTWLYAHLLFEVFVDKDKPVSIHSQVPGGVSVSVESLQQAMELLRRTEGLRQKRDLPYVCLC